MILQRGKLRENHVYPTGAGEVKGMMSSGEWTAICGRVVLADGILDDGMVVFQGERILYAGPCLEEYGQRGVVQKTTGFIWPGLIDVHVHGAGGADVMDGTPSSLRTMAKTLARHGVTGFLATTVTMDRPRLEKALANVAAEAPRMREGAEVLGVHLEGPWICPRHRGAQNPAYITDPRPQDAEWAWNASDGWLRWVTLAPERPGAPELIRRFADRGVVVSAGHTGATYEEMQEAIAAGVTHATHCFNAMTGLHHRQPGTVGAVLSDDRLTTEVIADGFHVHPAVIRLLAKVKERDSLLLITDGIRAVGLPDGRYELGGLTVYAKAGKATLEDGGLAGSLLTMDEAVRNMARYAHIPLWKAVRMASLAPAKKLGLDDRMGSLETGKLANIVLTDENCRVLRVWVKGRLIAEAEKKE
ncbi:N-acetylglucosamine-6-phosphate deacetylase [Polycladomyces sp. WAk]|uniref:N-acetylglucosamine-6-phosphate deacetylase n=1 Tax=Polycladomyces zharkentensis TaxID=2807616 RepID=A0ABS2WHB7_9BACL|nr:N-acetylglucosamine-6-phosphate deacetylase [Polycladomyces sp. WAk]MBN2908947.1 N-acetylglucosamine-6-phosphate deacetylase [Polycladomyces sp. WAk]